MTEAPGADQLRSCPKCKTTIAVDHPYAWCSECGKTLPRNKVIDGPASAGAPELVDKTAPLSNPVEAVPAALFGTPEKTTVCAMLGLLGLCLGLYVLVIAPADGASATVNLHRLYTGQTFAIIGAIFLAAAIRPR